MNKLSEGLTEEEFAPYLREVKNYGAGEYIVRAGERVSGFGVVLEGRVQVFKEDYFGNRSLLSQCREGDLFLEAVTLTQPENSPVNVQALTPCAVAVLDYARLFAPSGNCRAHARVLENLLRVLSGKVLALNRKISVLSKRTMRDKVLSYLTEEGGGKTEVLLPFGREAFADCLCVARSALSRELSHMKERGEIDFDGNLFRIRVNAPLD